MKFTMEWTCIMLVVLTLMHPIACTGVNDDEFAAKMELVQRMRSFNGMPVLYNAKSAQKSDTPIWSVDEVDGIFDTLLERAAAIKSTALVDLLKHFRNLWKPRQEDSLRVSEFNLEETMRDLEQETKMLVGIWALQNVSKTCLDHMGRYLSDYSNSVTYARQMVHSYGDYPSLENLEFLYTTSSLGNMEECQLTKEWNPDAPFEASYCTVIYPLFATGMYVVTGLCVPASCSATDLYQMTEGIPLAGPELIYNCVAPYPWNAGAIATLCICCGFLLIVIIGSLYHVTAHKNIQYTMSLTMEVIKEAVQKRHVQNVYESALTTDDAEEVKGADMVKSKDQSEPELQNGKGATNGHAMHVEMVESKEHFIVDTDAARKRLNKLGFIDTLLMGFSSIRNGSKILNTEQTAGSLACLNGIRVLSMFWIILGHTFSFQVGFMDDFRYPIDVIFPSFSFCVIVNSTVSVDVFFMLSGLLLTYLTLKHMKKVNGKMNWFIFYFHRLWRITPTYMIALAIWASLAIHMGEGPYKTLFFEDVADLCREQWWTNLLYINNLYPFPGDLNASCMGWAWYLANDMQFFFISPFILYLLYKKPKIGMTVIATLCLGSFGITAYLATYYGSPVWNHPAYNNNTQVVYGNPNADVIYGKPYCRIPAYLVGMVAGYIFYKQHGKPVKMSKFLNGFVWVLATGVALSVLFGPYRQPGNEFPQYASVLYLVFSRFSFAIAVAWVAFACVFGYGGPVNAFLSWGFWAPLSRITFGAYLLHPTLIFVIYNTAKSFYHVTYMQYALTFISNTVVSYFAAFLLSLFVEGPVMSIEKALLGGVGKKKIK
ncbi:O-acyltransferase like protein-like [Asterias rubens]|uniref:O-acyltransferase like protein-like n=1 Tax=Asterias rubens TaxID=7604 RepID=UPI0014550092|nr:O-acyltransferase like protein-like [Asterias rubens]